MVTLAAIDSKYNTQLSTEIANIIELNGFDNDDAMMDWLSGAYDDVVKLDDELDRLGSALDKSMVAEEDLRRQLKKSRPNPDQREFVTQHLKIYTKTNHNSVRRENV